MTSPRLPSLLRCWFSLVILGFLSACGKSEKKELTSTPAAGGTPALREVILQTDWYAQAEHGGFYQAIAEGYYEKRGLKVTIQPGGPGAFPTQKLATGQVQFAIGRSDDVMIASQQGLPLLMVGAQMQHDPQGILLHAENPIQTFSDLDGKTVMAQPGATWIQLLERRYKIRVNVMPLNYGVAQFLADKSFIQQCFVTNEPFYVRKSGAEPKTLLLADSGFDPYRVIITSRKFARENPEIVKAFVAASAEGWKSFIEGSNAGARALIRAHNDKMEDAFMDFTVSTLRDLRLIGGDPAKGETYGLLTPARMEAQKAALIDVGLLKSDFALEQAVSYDFLPDTKP